MAMGRFTVEQINYIAKALRNIPERQFTRHNVCQELMNVFDMSTPVYDRNKFRVITMSGEQGV